MKIIKELWKDIEGYEGVYQISSLGNVRRIKTFTNDFIQDKENFHYIKPTDNGNGYLIVGLKLNGKRKNYYVHRLVAKAFCNKNQYQTIVNHKDFDKQNNKADNLEWCTQRENVRYSSHKMKHEKSVCKPTNTGEKYITKIISHGKYESYRVNIRTKGICRQFKTLKEAVQFRNEVMCGGV